MIAEQMPESRDSVSRALIDAQARSLGKLRVRVEALEREMSILRGARAICGGAVRPLKEEEAARE